VGPIEQRFTGYELDEARRKGVGFGTLTPRLKETLALAEEGCTHFGKERMHLLQQEEALALAEEGCARFSRRKDALTLAREGCTRTTSI